MVFNSNNNNAIANKPVEIPFRASFDNNLHDEHGHDLHLANNHPPAVLQKANEVHAYVPEPETNQSGGSIAPNENNDEEEMVKANEMPVVPGQTPEELKAPEPLQEPVSIKTESHSPLDPFENSDNVAMFGSNLRHPEASMERTKPHFAGLENEIAAGLASKVSKPDDLEKAPFSAEMAQNGGEFMNGIFAFDSTSEGSYFSSI